MSAARYRRAIRILERWSTDPSKSERRDIAVLLREKIGDNFKKGDQSDIASREECDKKLNSLENICDDKYKLKYPLQVPAEIGALRCDFETCTLAASEEGMEQLHETEKSVKRLMPKFLRREEVPEEKSVKTKGKKLVT